MRLTTVIILRKKKIPSVDENIKFESVVDDDTWIEIQNESTIMKKDCNTANYASRNMEKEDRKRYRSCQEDDLNESDNIAHLIGGGIAFFGTVVGGLVKHGKNNKVEDSSPSHSNRQSPLYSTQSDVIIEELKDDEN